MRKTISLNKSSRRRSSKATSTTRLSKAKSPRTTKKGDALPKRTPRSTGILVELDDISKEVSAIEMKYNEQLGLGLQRVKLRADEIKKDDDAWREFCAAPKWTEFKSKKPDPEKPGNHLYYVMRYVCGPSESQQKNASFYRQGLEVLLGAKVRPDMIAAEIIKRGGLRKILETSRAPQSKQLPSSTSAKPPDDEPELSDADLLDTDDAAVPEEKSKTTATVLSAKAASGSGGNKKSSRRMRDFEGGIFVECDPLDFEELMELKKGTAFDCSCEALGPDETGFRRFKLTSI